MEKSNMKERLSKRVHRRTRGLIALMMAIMIATGFMPMQSVKAATLGGGENAYYLVCYGEGNDDTQFLGSGNINPTYASSEEENGLYYPLSFSGSLYLNDWVKYYQDLNHTWDVQHTDIFHKFQELKKGDIAEIDLATETRFYYGRVNSHNTSGFVIINGGQKAARGMTTLAPGNYKITNNGIVDHNYIISLTPAKITLSETALEFTVGDPAKKLTVTPSDYEVTWESSDDKVAKVSESGEVTAVAEGEATKTASLNLDPDTKATCTVTVKAAPDDKKAEEPKKDDPKKDDPIKDKDGNETGYVVSNADKANFEAEYKGTANDKKAKKVKILDTITDANGNVFKVTSIADNALKNAKGKELIIGKNINKIGKKAFKGAKFKKITIRTGKKGKIKIGKNAFKVKNKNCVVKLKGVKGKNKEKLANKILKQATDGVTVK